MTKYRSGAKYDEADLIHYKLETLEKRLDHIEGLLHSKLGAGASAGPTTELVHLLMDMVRQQAAPARAEQQQQPPSQPAPAAPQPAAKADPLDAFDAAACMSRRRTIV